MAAIPEFELFPVLVPIVLTVELVLELVVKPILLVELVLEDVLEKAAKTLSKTHHPDLELVYKVADNVPLGLIGVCAPSLPSLS